MQLKKGIYAIILAGGMFMSGCGANDQKEDVSQVVQQETEQEIKQNENNLQQEESMSEPVIPGIICWGDSLTYGHNGEGTSYPSVLEKKIKENIDDEISVVNMGACGEDSITIAGRSGGIPFVTASDITIPAEKEAIDVSFLSADGKEVHPSLYTDVGINECEIAGVVGTLSIQNVGQKESKYTFIRKIRAEYFK